MRRFITIASTILSLLVGIAALFVLGSLVPIDGNYSFRIVESGSMEPAIQTGSVVAIIPRDAYYVGDVVTFAGTSVNPEPTTHRLIGVVSENGHQEFTTQGDANEDPDYRHIGRDEILGKVFLTVPYAGYAARFFATPSGRATLVVLALLLLIASFVPWRRIMRRSNKESPEHTEV